MTKTQEAKLRYNQEYSAAYARYMSVIKAEFPKGAKVRWKSHGKWQEGVVIEDWYFGDRIHIRNTRTGTTRQIEARDLEHLETK